jgi:hypothetical protein
MEGGAPAGLARVAHQAWQILDDWLPRLPLDTGHGCGDLRRLDGLGNMNQESSTQHADYPS